MRRQDQMKIAEAAEWTLFERTDSSSGEWRSMRLVRQTKRFIGGKLRARFLFGWNGERLSRNTDTWLLAKHEPEIYAWVIQELSRAAGSRGDRIALALPQH
jgi:hypothetical protein